MKSPEGIEAFTSNDGRIRQQFFEVNPSFILIMLSGNGGSLGKRCHCECCEVLVSGSNNALAQGIFKQLKPAVDIQLSSKVGLVSFYSFGANAQHSGYLLSGVPFCQQL